MKLSQRLTLGYIRTKFKLLSAISKKKAAARAFYLFCTPQWRNRKPVPAIFQQAESLHFNLEGIVVRGWRWNHPTTSGRRAAVRSVLILHGFESSVTNFERYIKPLWKKGYEVLAFDAPAHGRSGGRKINAPLYKRMILEICKRYGPVKSFMAHSFGGLAVCLALEEFSHTDEYRLALIAPATETTTAIDSFFSFLQLDPEVRREFDRILIKTAGVPPEYYSIRRAMKHIRARVLWLHDQEDDTTPLHDVEKVKEAHFPNIEFIITKGLGHSRIYRDSNVAKAIIEFL